MSARGTSASARTAMSARGKPASARDKSARRGPARDAENPDKEPLLSECEETNGVEDDKPGSDVEAEQIEAGGSIVQLSAPIYYGDKRDGVIAIDIVRHGGLAVRSSCIFETQDHSAKAGQTYTSTIGEVVFERGEQIKSVEVPLIRNGIWAATLEFKLQLSEPKGCTLGAYLHVGRVKVIDDGCFPTSKVREALASGELSSFPGLDLFTELCRWMSVQEGMGWRTMLCIFMDQLRNIYLLAVIWADMYYVNVVCSRSEAAEESLIMPTRDETVYLLAAINILPVVLLHVWDMAKVRLDLLGNATLYLQKCLFRKYLNLSEASKEDVRPEILQVAVLDEAEVVAGGYVGALVLLVTAGNIAINVAFVMLRTPDGVLYGLAVPVLVLLWGIFRDKCFNPVGAREETARLTHFTTEACREEDLIAAFYLRPQINSGFSERADAVKARLRARSAFAANTDFILRWLSPLAVGAYMIFSTSEVVSGELPLGHFLATVALIRKLGAESAGFYATCHRINSTLIALKHVTAMLNRETDLYQWKKVMRQRRGSTVALLEQTAGERTTHGSVHSDALPISCTGLSMSIGEGAHILQSVNISLAQGKIVMVRGPHGSGKNILLSLLAHRLFPTAGEIFVPSHLRTLLVSFEPHFLERSLLENLTLGNPHFTESSLPRLRAILQDLSLHKAIEVLDQEVAGAQKINVGKWLKTLTSADKHSLTMARAFMMNPEVLLLQRPFGIYQPEKRVQLGQVILEHRQNRGLRLPRETAHIRRPRTIFLTADTLHKDADVVINMEPRDPRDLSAGWTTVTQTSVKESR